MSSLSKIQQCLHACANASPTRGLLQDPFSGYTAKCV
jgi:hypothetical protein